MPAGKSELYAEDHYPFLQCSFGSYYHDDSYFPLQIICLTVVDGRWAACAWDFVKKQVTMFAPSNRAYKKQDNWLLHKQILSRLHGGLQKCCEEYFNRWDVGWEQWVYVFLCCSNPAR